MYILWNNSYFKDVLMNQHSKNTKQIKLKTQSTLFFSILSIFDDEHTRYLMSINIKLYIIVDQGI